MNTNFAFVSDSNLARLAQTAELCLAEGGKNEAAAFYIGKFLEGLACHIAKAHNAYYPDLKQVGRAKEVMKSCSDGRRTR